MKHPLLRYLSSFFLAALSIFFLSKGFGVAHDQYRSIQDLPRNEDVPPFDPHRGSFTCQLEAANVPPVDAQADAWLHEARTLDDPDMWEEERDYKKIVQLTRQAAERRHWKAMLNLATLYLERRDPSHGEIDALVLVEQAMRLGVPAAYDRMGTYYMNSVGVPGDPTKAFAFWQKAAEMGNPHAMGYLGPRISSTWDIPDEGYWANIPVATKMLECALAQGYGPAAYKLAWLRQWPRGADNKITGERTPATKSLGIKILQDGVKYGCSDCARSLSVEFRNPIDLADMLVPFLDSARSERYAVLENALGRNPLLRFPNLDKVLPLPPTPLPPWDGDKQTLIDSAKGVTPRPASRLVSVASQRQGRYHLDAAYDLQAGDETTTQTAAPFSSYWQATAPTGSAQLRAWLATVPPGLYQTGESFDLLQPPPDMGSRPIQGLVWRRFLTVHHNQGAVDPKSAAGSTREIARMETIPSCDSQSPCPATGIWQLWLPLDHPMSYVVNQPWRQAWLPAGQEFPEISIADAAPEADGHVQWHLLEGVVN